MSEKELTGTPKCVTVTDTGKTQDRFEVTCGGPSVWVFQTRAAALRKVLSVLKENTNE